MSDNQEVAAEIAACSKALWTELMRLYRGDPEGEGLTYIFPSQTRGACTIFALVYMSRNHKPYRAPVFNSVWLPGKEALELLRGCTCTKEMEERWEAAPSAVTDPMELAQLALRHCDGAYDDVGVMLPGTQDEFKVRQLRDEIRQWTLKENILGGPPEMWELIGAEACPIDFSLLWYVPDDAPQPRPERTVPRAVNIYDIDF